MSFYDPMSPDFPFTIGIEEEYQVVDPETRELRSYITQILERGQTILREHGMGSIRADVGVPAEQSHLTPVRIQAIRIGPGLLVDLDNLMRAQFLRRWPHLPVGGEDRRDEARAGRQFVVDVKARAVPEEGR